MSLDRVQRPSNAQNGRSTLQPKTFFNDNDSVFSETSSAVSDNDYGFYADMKQAQDEDADLTAAGTLPEELYANTLPWWRAEVRRRLVRAVEWETAVLERFQRRTRTPWLDAYFVQTSMLGTHTFFMCFLPIFFFFGGDSMGRGLCYCLAFGVYSSSFVKDLVCSPRPYAPPVTRLTIGSHHLEYGFPSTHSTNSMSMALFFLAEAYSLLCIEAMSPHSFVVCTALCSFYVASIVGGRLYMGMHGFVDCAVGVMLGTAMWALQWAAMPVVERWVMTGHWSVPLIVTAICLLMVNQHPQPVDDCPCFEDAIAFVSVVLGILLGLFSATHLAPLDATTFTTRMPGAPFAPAQPGAMLTFYAVALLKLVCGILAIFAWRLAAKPTLQAVLPPLFRWLARASPVDLPNRRHYKPATEYVGAPVHEGNLRAVPSVIDLDMTLGEGDGEEWQGVASGRRDLGDGRKGAVKRRGMGPTSAGGVREKTIAYEDGRMEEAEVVKHYDADVLTKVFVYAGIGFIATIIAPAAFEVLGWGVRI
ncbi:hypothetical protein DENSPDRAFT_845349 [Dentipellis sp. KUC8613]|nr:hypothetical protein DENSPDRAFT_845349 [Dentipellis sp. KUC8613]